MIPNSNVIVRARDMETSPRWQQFLPLNSSLFDDNQWILWTALFADAFSISRILRPGASAKEPAPREDQ